MVDEIVRAFALVMIIEGLMPFIAPAAWRRAMARVITQNDNAIRTAALIGIGVGVLILNIAGSAS